MRTTPTCSAAAGGYDNSLPLTADRVDCWVVALSTIPGDAEDMVVTILSSAERERAGRFYNELQRQRYLRSHAALRLLLARYLKRPPDSFVIATDTFGRPMLKESGGGLVFNLSCSTDVALVGISLGSPLGVDIERVRQIPDSLAIAEQCFAPNEFENLLRLTPEQRCDSFFVTWTRKEAFVKALGVGLSCPLDSFCTGSPDRPPRLTVGATVSSGWTIADLVPLNGYKAAVAVRQTDVAVHCQEARWRWLLD